MMVKRILGPIFGFLLGILIVNNDKLFARGAAARHLHIDHLARQGASDVGETAARNDRRRQGQLWR